MKQDWLNFQLKDQLFNTAMAGTLDKPDDENKEEALDMNDFLKNLNTNISKPHPHHKIDLSRNSLGRKGLK